MICVKPIRIVGIDPGSCKTGYAFLEVDPDERSLQRVRAVDFGVIHTARAGGLPARLAFIHRRLKDLLDHHSPGEAAVEDLFHHKNALSALKLGQARGAAILTLALCGAKVYSYPPAIIKKSISGYGGADKRQVGEMVRAILGLRERPPADAADALAIAVHHAHQIQLRLLKEMRQRRDSGILTPQRHIVSAK